MVTGREELADIAADLRGWLDWLRENGVRDLPAPRVVELARPKASNGRAEPAAQPAPRPRSLRELAQAATSQAPTQAAQAPLVDPSAPRRTLEEIRTELGDCKRCKLSAKRKHIVFGVGSPTAELVFVGEAPGADEDAQGVPFVGLAGQLLTKMIEAMGFSRSDVYICNVVKCRPPGNRNPEPDEIAACEPFLKAQLASLRPKVIVALGKFAAQTLLRDATAITRMRGKWRSYCGIKLMPTFHPAYLLRSPDEKRKAWDDLKLVMIEFGRQPGGKGNA